MTYDRAELQGLKRKDLVVLCKQFSIKCVGKVRGLFFFCRILN